MSSPQSRILVSVLVLITLTSFMPQASIASQQRADTARIHLRSRQFTPPAGMDPALQARLVTSQRDRLHVLLQLPDIPDTAKRQRLASNGARLLNYIPDHAWFASIPTSPAAVQRIQGEARWLGLITAADKIAPSIQQQGVGPWARQANGDVDLQVSFFSDVALADRLGIVNSIGARVLSQEPEFQRLTLRLPENQIAALADQDEVRWIVEVPPPPVHFNEDARRSVEADSVQNGSNTVPGSTTTIAANTASGVRVGVWDGGAIGSHTDLNGRVLLMDAAASSNDHATHVAGTIGGTGSVSSGKHKGMAPGASLYSWDWNEPVVEHQEAVTNGVVISSNSWGYAAGRPWCTPYGSYQWSAPEYDQVVRGLYGAPILVVFAAGNNQGDTGCNSSGYDSVSPPATAKNTVTVGAVNSNDSSMTNFSSWGPNDDGRLTPHVVAPGCQSNDDGGVTSTLPGDIYASWCGTSMATPATSGVAALIIEQYRQSFGGETPLPSTTKALLAHTATDLGNAGPDYKHGYGLINARRATQLVAGTSGIYEGTISQGGEAAYTVQASDSVSVKATLVWSDKEAAENASKTLVNDLDLVITGPNGATFWPWVLNPAAPSAAATTGTDSTNTIEQVLVSEASAGTWTVQVKGTSLPAGSQSFSLIITAAAAEAESTPTPTPVPQPSVPGQFEVEDYKPGGQNIGYYDTSTGNAGGAYRTDDVDIQTCTDATSPSPCYNVGWIDAGEWLAYDMTVSETDNYTFTVRVAAPTGGKSFYLTVNGINISGPISVPTTGDWQNWTSVTTGALALEAGTHELRIVTDTGGFNLNYVVVEVASTTTPTDPPAGITLSANGYKVKGVQTVDLTWSGATSTNVDVYRSGAKITTTANDGAHTDNIGKKGGGSYTYKVCEAGTSTCSNEVTISF